MTSTPFLANNTFLFLVRLVCLRKQPLRQIKAMTTCREVNKRLRGKRRRESNRDRKKYWLWGRNISPLLNPLLSLVWVLIHGWWVNEGKCACSPLQSLKLHSFILRQSLRLDGWLNKFLARLRRSPKNLHHHLSVQSWFGKCRKLWF